MKKTMPKEIIINSLNHYIGFLDIYHSNISIFGIIIHIKYLVINGVYYDPISLHRF